MALRATDGATFRGGSDHELVDPRDPVRVPSSRISPRTLVQFDIDTTELEEQAGEIRQQMQQIAEQYQQASEKQRQQEDVRTGMYQ